LSDAAALTCPLCGGSDVGLHAVADDIEYFTSAREFAFYRCPSCDVLFVHPMLHDRLNEIYPSNYYAFQGSREGLLQRAKGVLDRRLFGAVLRDVPGQALSALDIGGGAGWLLDAVKASDARVAVTQVVDIDPAAGAAAERAGHRYWLGPIEDFATDERFDLVLMLNLIEHVQRPDRVLSKARDLLTGDGRILVKTPNFDALDARLFRHRSWGGYHTPRHFVLFTKESFSRLARAQGLEVASFTYTQGAPFWSVSILNELRRLGLVSCSKERPTPFHPLSPLLQAGFAAFDFARRPVAKTSQMLFVLRRAA
jgi:2-polyprenyl-3-methyl-5-hydroxy-6-metoxy-1,4-benzoquinol methylase